MTTWREYLTTGLAYAGRSFYWAGVSVAVTVELCVLAGGAFLPEEPLPPAPVVIEEASQDIDPESAPILLQIDPDVSAEWRIEAAAELWEQATGCDLFTFEPTHEGQLTYRIMEEANLETADGAGAAGLAMMPDSGADSLWIKLDPEWKDWNVVAVHELGHALGIYHTGEAEDIMSGLAPTHDRTDLSEYEVVLARELNAKRCR